MNILMRAWRLYPMHEKNCNSIPFYTLVSSVGIGMYKTEKESYRETTYQFPSGERCTTRSFIEALLQKQYRPVKKLVLVGTVTSMWDAFIDQTGPQNGDLWCSVREACEGKGISPDTAAKLETYISERYHIPCTILAHTPVIDSATSGELFSSYSRIASEVAPGTNVLLDITHGFRSMPLLMYQALQFSASEKMIRHVELVYGEYIAQQQISYVRDLSSYWDYSEITFAVNLFESRFEGNLLAGKLYPFWQAGSACVKKFSDIVACNYALQLDEVLRQIRNALEKHEVPEEPAWVKAVRQFLSSIAESLSAESVSGRLLKYSELLEAHNLLVQAVITLQTAVETAVTEKYGNESYFGDYGWWHEYGKEEYERIKHTLTPDYQEFLRKIEIVRNGAAHAGGRDKYTKEYPSVSSLPGVFREGRAAVLSLFHVLDGGDI